MRGSFQTRSCVPLPWWTSKSTMATRSSPWRVEGVAGADHGVAEVAEAHRGRGLGVVAGRADGAEGVADLARQHHVDRLDDGAGAAAGGGQRAGREEGVAVDRREAAVRARGPRGRRCGRPGARARWPRRSRAGHRRATRSANSSDSSAASIACSRSTRSGWPGRVDVSQAVVVGEERRRHQRSLWRRRNGSSPKAAVVGARGAPGESAGGTADAPTRSERGRTNIEHSHGRFSVTAQVRSPTRDGRFRSRECPSL